MGIADAPRTGNVLNLSWAPLASPSNPWLPPADQQARLRLYCFPFAGGGPSIFASWRSQLAPDVAVCPLQLPGREARLRESPIPEIPGLVTALANAIDSRLDSPYVFLGCSFGALLAYELTRELRHRGRPLPLRLIVVSHSAPGWSRLPTMSHLSDADFIAALQSRYEAIPAAILADPEVLGMFLPVLRADFMALETYRHSPEAALPLPIDAWYGSLDQTLTRDGVAAWASHTTGSFALHELPAGHFFQRDPRLIQHLRRQLAEELA